MSVHVQRKCNSIIFVYNQSVLPSHLQGSGGENSCEPHIKLIGPSFKRGPLDHACLFYFCSPLRHAFWVVVGGGLIGPCPGRFRVGWRVAELGSAGGFPVCSCLGGGNICSTPQGTGASLARRAGHWVPLPTCTIAPSLPCRASPLWSGTGWVSCQVSD